MRNLKTGPGTIEDYPEPAAFAALGNNIVEWQPRRALHHVR